LFFTQAKNFSIPLKTVFALSENNTYWAG